MAYQPIQVGSFDRTSDALDTIGARLMQARQLEQQRAEADDRRREARERLAFDREKFADENKRQRQMDVERVLLKAKELADNGDLDAAHNLLANYGFNRQTGKPDVVPTARPPEAPIQGGSALPDGVENAQRAAAAPTPPAPRPEAPGLIPPPIESDPEAETRGQPAAPGGRPAVNPAIARMFSQVDPRQLAADVGGQPAGAQAPAAAPSTAAPPPAAPPSAQAAPPDSDALPPIMAMESADPVVKARQQEIARERARAEATKAALGQTPGPSAAAEPQAPADRRVRYLGPNGETVTLDPDARRRYTEEQTARVRAQNLAAFDQMLSQVDPELKKYVARLRPGVALADKPLSADDFNTAVSSMMNRDAQVAATSADKEAQRALTEKEKEKDRAAGLEGKRIIANAILGAAAKRAMPEVRIDAANRGALGELDSTIQKYNTSTQLKQLVVNDRQLHNALGNILKDGPDSVLQHKDAFIALERAIRGGIPSEGETALLLNSLGGIEGGIQNLIAKVKSGDLSEIARRNIYNAIKTLREHQDAAAQQYIAGLREIVGPGSGYENMAPQVNARVRGYARGAGIVDVPDVYPDVEGGVVLGSGKRPVVKPKTPSPGGFNVNDEVDKILKKTK